MHHARTLLGLFLATSCALVALWPSAQEPAQPSLSNARLAGVARAQQERLAPHSEPGRQSAAEEPAPVAHQDETARATERAEYVARITHAPLPALNSMVANSELYALIDLLEADYEAIHAERRRLGQQALMHAIDNGRGVAVPPGDLGHPVDGAMATGYLDRDGVLQRVALFAEDYPELAAAYGREEEHMRMASDALADFLNNPLPSTEIAR